MLNYLFRMGDGTMETAAFLLPLAMVLFLGPWVIRELQAMKAGQPVREAHGNVHAPDHTAKAGTPTMGGILLIGAALVYALLFLPLENVRVQCVLLVTVVTAFLGFLDDYAKIKRHNSVGVNGWFKIVLQAIAAAFCAMYLYCTDESVCGILVPFYGFVDIGWLSIPLAVLTIIATSNAVNLTDGLDGLASGCMIPASLFYIVVLPVMQVGSEMFGGEGISLACYAIALLAACVGFLWYNCHPAHVFMGDTGSLALGGALGAMAVCTGTELMLIILAGVFVAEASSVMVQVLWFKITRRLCGEGRRFFRMAPLHHHFEKGGMSETQVCVRFWIVSWFLLLIALFACVFYH